MYKKKLWSFTKLFLKFLITGLSLYLVFTKAKLTDIEEAFTNADFLYLLIALLFFVASQIVASSRLNTFFKSIGLQLSGVLNFKVYLLGMFYNLFLPGGIGGDGYKVFFLKKKYNARGKDLLFSIFFDRLSGLWALSLITAVLIVFIPGLHIPSWIPITVVVVGTAVYAISSGDVCYFFTVCTTFRWQVFTLFARVSGILISRYFSFYSRGLGG